jgi:hypothetical protein
LFVLQLRGMPHTIDKSRLLAPQAGQNLVNALEIPMSATPTIALAPAAKATEVSASAATTLLARVLKAIDKACAAGAEGARGL